MEKTKESQVSSIDGEVVTSDESIMDIVYVPDRAGNTLRLQRFEGKYYIPFYKPSTFEGIRTIDLRSDDVFFPGYLRTGTNWIFEVISMLLAGSSETVQRNKTKHLLEISTDKYFESMPSPRVLCTHMRLSDAPNQLLDKKCKVVYTLRDPKDVAVSLYNLYSDIVFCDYRGDFKDFLYLFLEGKVDCNGMFGHLRDAEVFFETHPDIPVHIQVYEDAIEGEDCIGNGSVTDPFPSELRPTSNNPLNAVQKLSDFLGLKRNNELCHAIAEKCEFSRLKVDKDPFAVKVGDRCILFRKGIVGDWKNWFTDQMLEDYYQVYEEKMAGSRFYQRYARDTL